MHTSMDPYQLLDYYKEFGYCVMPEALSPDEVEYLTTFVDKDRGDILCDHPELDRFARHPKTFPLFKEILGPDIRFAQLDFRHQRVGTTDDSQTLHRDISYFGTVGGKIWDPDNPFISTYACAIYYLSDVHECCPCLGVVPKSHTYRTLEAAKEAMGDEYTEIPLRPLAAGTAILYNITTYHGRMAGDAACQHGRRTLHNYQSRESNAPLTDWAKVPEVLALSDNPDTRRYYSQWTPQQIAWARETYDGEIPAFYP